MTAPRWKTTLEWVERGVLVVLLVFVAYRLAPQVGALTGIGPTLGSVPDLAFVTLDGETFTSADLRGDVVVLNFWATWCVPCFQEHEVLMDGARRYADAAFLGVVYQDEVARVKRFSTERGAAYPSLVDEQGRTAIAYGVYGVPETFFIGPDGTITDKYVGPLTPRALAERIAQARRGAAAGAP